MNLKIITQPFDGDGTPQTVGRIFTNLLAGDEPFYNRVWIVSAFANEQAVLKLVPLLQSAKERGAEIHIVVGVDHHGTSIEALTQLLALDVDTRVFHNNRPGHTFHPKIYLLEASADKAVLFLGSNNLTEGGFYTNYEAAIMLSFDLIDEIEIYQAARYDLDKFLTPGGSVVKALTQGLIDLLAVCGDIVTEAQKNQERASTLGECTNGGGVERRVPSSPFGTEKIPPAPRIRIVRRIRDTVTNSERIGAIREKPQGIYEAPTGEQAVQPASRLRGRLLWEKRNLPASDVQRQPGNPTGGLRMTQAGWRVKGQVIDQTTYFRNDLFGTFNWTKGILNPKMREAIQVPCWVIILGVDYGMHDITISHKPSGEAGQGNYTTIMHWGDLSEDVRQANLIGKTFLLYEPVSVGGPYTILVQ